MQSTGKEKFMVYIYFKTEKYDSKHPWSDSESDAESEGSESSDEVVEINISDQKKTTMKPQSLKIEIDKRSIMKKTVRKH